MPSERDASVNDEEILANHIGRVLTLGIVASYVMPRVSFYLFSSCVVPLRGVPILARRLHFTINSRAVGRPTRELGFMFHIATVKRES